MYILIKALVFAVLIHINGGVDHGVVHTGIKIHLIIGAALYHNFVQLFFPKGLPVRFYLVKIPAGYFNLHIVKCTVHAYRRYRHLYFYLLAFVGFKVKPRL